MRGIGEASAAITFVNALPTGVGAAAGIDLSVRVEVELSAATTSGSVTALEVVEGERSELVDAAFRVGIEEFAKDRPIAGRLWLRSEIPVARGLKSSSAVSVAILRAVAKAVGREVSAEEVARRSAELSHAIGLSATGAFDDALACAEGGVVATDNSTRRVLRRMTLPSSLRVLLWVPPGTHSASPRWMEAFRARAAEGQAVVDALLAGDLFEAMERNTILVESVLQYDYASARRRLKEAGAQGAGVSGLGPALAAVLPEERLEDGRSALGPVPGQLRAASFTTPRTPAGAAP